MKFNLDNNLTMEELGLYVTMIEMPTADYATVDYLSTLSTDGKEATQKILNGLIDKGYLLRINDKYAINKAVMLEMIKK